MKIHAIDRPGRGESSPAAGDGIYTLPAHSVGVLFARAGSRRSREIS